MGEVPPQHVMRTPDASRLAAVLLDRRKSTPMMAVKAEFLNYDVTPNAYLARQKSLDLAGSSQAHDLGSSLSHSFYGGGAEVDESPVTLDEANAAIQRYVNIGDHETALYWIDHVYAKESEQDGGVLNLERAANYIKLLCSVQCWLRVLSLCERHSLPQRHIVFAYHYLTALYHRKQYMDIVQAPIGHLLDISSLPLVSASPSPSDDSPRPGSPQHAVLDGIAKELNLVSSVLVLLGRTFILMENREAAASCLHEAFLRDKTCVIAEQLLSRYNLVPDEHLRRFDKIAAGRASSSSSLDPRQKTATAIALYSKGDVRAAADITTALLDEHGLYTDCLLVHVSALTALMDCEAMFLLAHRLVDAMPDSEMAWYAVALYYHICGNVQCAKTFMNKAVMMNNGFGEGWVAYGHILAADSEHEQAMNCYLRAARVLERHHEPLLYVAMEYCATNNSTLAGDFLKDAHQLAPEDPVVVHEQGALAYADKKYEEAERLLERALHLATGSQTSEDTMTVFDKRLDAYWEPLVNNLAHVSRRLGKYKAAVLFHEKSLQMVPRKASTIISLGVCHASMGNVTEASNFFHQALALKPFNPVARAALERLVATAVDASAHLFTDMTVGNENHNISADDLAQELSTEPSKGQTDALELVMSKKRAAAGKKTDAFKQPDVTPAAVATSSTRAPRRSTRGHDDSMEVV